MSNLIKYPRTPHLPASPGATSDDKHATKQALDHLSSGVDLVVTEKMDGGNVTLYHDDFHARSLSSKNLRWEGVARSIWGQVRADIPEGWRVSAESMHARRSVAYDNLPCPLIVFGVWNESNEMLPWDDIETWTDLWGLPHAPVLYRGLNFMDATQAWATQRDQDTSEGFVLRDADGFHYDQFALRVAKWVRADHVRTESSWRHRMDYPTNTFESF